MWKCFLKFNDDNIRLKDHNHLQISEQIIDRRKLNNNLKRTALNVIYVLMYKIYSRVAIYIKNRNGMQFTATAPLYTSIVIINVR